MKRAANAAYWLIPPLVCAAVYWAGLKVWFQQDDFAWLGLKDQIHSFSDLLKVLFAPMAQGTIRTWSERAFFIVFSSVFGIDPLPFRIWVLLTQLANVVLLSEVVRRVSGSKLAGFAASIFWVLNAALVTPMLWTSAYNQVLCAFFLLAAFLLWVRYTETGDRRFLVAQWVVFILGFGALEVNVVYPALAMGYALACAPKYWKKALPLFTVSALYLVLHWWVAPKASSGVYGVHFDLRILKTLATYWYWAFGGTRLGRNMDIPRLVGLVATKALPAAILLWVAWRAWQRRWVPLFFLGWFVIVLAPVLPLPEHMTDYYLAAPSTGLAALLGIAFAEYCRVGLKPQLLIVAVVAECYLWTQWPQIRMQERFYVDRGKGVKKLVLGVAEAGKLYPGRTILLTGISDDLFWTGVLDNPFRLFGVNDVYLAPGAERQVVARPEFGAVGDYTLPEAAALAALKRGTAVVYDASGKVLRNVTDVYERRAFAEWHPGLAAKIDPGKAYFEGQLGPGWGPQEGALRWTTERATVLLPGGTSLSLAFFCPRSLTAPGPAHLTVDAEGQVVAKFTLEKQDDWHEFTAPLPAGFRDRSRIECHLVLDRVSGGKGIAFGRIEVLR